MSEKQKQLYSITECPIDKATSYKQIKQLAQSKKYDLFINLCDGANEEDKAGPEVVQALEAFNVPFTGSSSVFYSMTKETMKYVAYSSDISTPPHVFAYSEEDIQLAIKSLLFPMIVKHYNGFNSLGMTAKALVRNEAELLEQAKITIGEYGGALIEEFIEGREFTVLVCENPDNQYEPLVYTPVECIFTAGDTFKHFDLKWKDEHSIKWKAVENP